MGNVKESIIRKYRTVVIIVLGIVVITTIHIVSSSKLINKGNYRKSAWEYTKHDKTIIDWDKASVDIIKLPPSKSLALSQINKVRFNRILLNLNGNQAVRVTFHTEMDVIVGPLVIYYNPFTKQVIGIDFRE
jgi:hypothetical protein